MEHSRRERRDLRAPIRCRKGFRTHRTSRRCAAITRGKNPDRLSMATVGAGSPGHLLGFLFQKETGARFGLVAYRGAGPAMQDVVAGQIDAMFSNTATALPQVLSGNVKAFAVTAKH